MRKTLAKNAAATSQPKGFAADAPKQAVAPFDAVQAKKHQEEWAAYLQVPVEYTNSIGMKFRLIPPGEYLRGSPDSDRDADRQEKPQHRVRITKATYLGVHEVTQSEWKAILATEPWKKGEAFKEGADFAAGNIPWAETQEFCRSLGQREGRTYRLPTDAEWEHACRAGTTTRFSFGDDETMLGDYGWYKSNALEAGEKSPVAVGLKKSNPFGLFDMHGNATEWCQDIYEAPEYDRYEARTLDDPQGPAANHSSRVHRGGGFYEMGVWCRSARRKTLSVGNRSDGIGLRVLLELDSSDALKPAIAPFYAAQAKKRPEEWADELKVNELTAASRPGTVWDTNGIKMRFRWCPDGTFQMGSPPNEPERETDGRENQVSVSLSGFWLGQHEVSQSDWTAVAGTTAAAQRDKEVPKNQLYGEGPTFPMYYVNYDEATDFAEKLTRQERAAGRLPSNWRYRLPTEAQWEYACRAGSTTATAFGDKLGSVDANFNGNEPYNGAANGPYLQRTSEIRNYAPNDWGFHDMHGNVWEWCSDFYGRRLPGGKDPENVEPALSRVCRGGCWNRSGALCRSASRIGNAPGRRIFYLGFRLAIVRVGP